jgi:hypothetical protein
MTLEEEVAYFLKLWGEEEGEKGRVVACLKELLAVYEENDLVYTEAEWEEREEEWEEHLNDHYLSTDYVDENYYSMDYVDEYFYTDQEWNDREEEHEEDLNAKDQDIESNWETAEEWETTANEYEEQRDDAREELNAWMEHAAKVGIDQDLLCGDCNGRGCHADCGEMNWIWET